MDYSQATINSWVIEHSQVLGMVLAYILLFLFAFIIWKNWDKFKEAYAERMVKVYLKNEQLREIRIRKQLEKEKQQHKNEGNHG